MSGPKHRTTRWLRQFLMPLTLCVASMGPAAADQSLDRQLRGISEQARYVPEQALPQLLLLERQARAADGDTKAELLSQLSMAQRGLGRQDVALALADELIAIGQDGRHPVGLAKGLLAKGEIMVLMNDLERSHALLWQAEKVAGLTNDLALQSETSVASGQAFAEAGNFPVALNRLQSAVATARRDDQPIVLITALNALARLQRQMKDYERGFSTLKEAMDLAQQIGASTRVAALLNTEYLFTSATKQPARGLKVLLEALDLQTAAHDTATIHITLVNLSDSYLIAKNYPKARMYATQAISAARRVKDVATEATAYVNIGEAQLGMGNLIESKQNFERGLALYETSGDKPALQSMLLEYGTVLEQACDMAGAIAAYHRERALSNEMFENARQKAVNELQQRYQADDRERRIELLSRENQVKSAEIDNRRLQQRVWWLLAVVFTMGSVIVALLYRKVQHANAQLQVKNLELKQQSVRDPLTLLYNRRHFQEFMRSYAQHDARSPGTPGTDTVGAMFLLDVDHFKNVNDGYGHAAGDAVLKMIAENLGVILRETDMIVRWGGEEFLAFLPAISRNGVDDIARRLLTGIAAQGIDYQGQRIAVNVSVGFASYPLLANGVPISWERTVNLVDMALYMAKSHGRNRAYGITNFDQVDEQTIVRMEQDLEQAANEGLVELSVIHGMPADPRASTVASTETVADMALS